MNQMNEFVFLFRQPENNQSERSPEEMHKKWMDWFDEISAQGKLANPGIRLAVEGNVLKPGGVVTDGPFVEIREMLGGFIVVKADTMDDAVTLAHGCPVLIIGGSVEIRPAFV